MAKASFPRDVSYIIIYSSNATSLQYIYHALPQPAERGYGLLGHFTKYLLITPSAKCKPCFTDIFEFLYFNY